MNRAAAVAATMVVCVLACASAARAQDESSPDPRAFVTVNVGAQPQRRTLATAATFRIFDEVAAVTSTDHIRNGAIFDISVGYRLWEHVALGVGGSTFGRRGSGTVAASLPDPIFYGRPRTVTSDTPGLEHTERGVHVQFVWMIPAARKIEVALSAGPSVFYLRQQLTPAVNVSADGKAVTVTPVRESGVGIGANAGFQGTYLFTTRYGAGIFARYTGGSVDLPSVSNVTVGGFETGLSFSLRF